MHGICVALQVVRPCAHSCDRASSDVGNRSTVGMADWVVHAPIRNASTTSLHAFAHRCTRFAPAIHGTSLGVAECEFVDRERITGVLPTAAVPGARGRGSDVVDTWAEDAIRLRACMAHRGCRRGAPRERIARADTKGRRAAADNAHQKLAGRIVCVVGRVLHRPAGPPIPVTVSGAGAWVLGIQCPPSCMITVCRPKRQRVRGVRS